MYWRQMIVLLFVLLGMNSRGTAEETIFSDDFSSTEIAADWEVHDGDWFIEDGALINKDGGMISLKMPPGGRFILEFDIAFPSNWMSIIPFLTKPDNYGTFYLTNGYWETFEMKGEQLVDYTQHRDADIVTGGGFHAIKVVSEFGLVTLEYDGQAKGPTTFPYRPGARVGFRSLPKSGLVKIKNFRLSKMPMEKEKIVARFPVRDFSQAALFKDAGLDASSECDERLHVDAPSNSASFNYAFTEESTFESCFARLPIAADRGRRLMLEVEGDGSENNFFIIVHDASGEQHLVMKTLIAWQGWQEVGVNLEPFLTPPPKMERYLIHWGGDENQTIDFPLTAIDVGVAKTGSRLQHSGRIGVKAPRVTE